VAARQRGDGGQRVHRHRVRGAQCGGANLERAPMQRLGPPLQALIGV
jgi:hypothetical protein